MSLTSYAASLDTFIHISLFFQNNSTNPFFQFLTHFSQTFSFLITGNQNPDNELETELETQNKTHHKKRRRSRANSTTSNESRRKSISSPRSKVKKPTPPKKKSKQPEQKNTQKTVLDSGISGIENTVVDSMPADPQMVDKENSEAMLPDNCVRVKLTRGPNGYGFSIIGGVDQAYRQLGNVNEVFFVDNNLLLFSTDLAFSGADFDVFERFVVHFSSFSSVFSISKTTRESS